MDAARALGAGNGRVILVHILPNISAPIIIIATLGLGTAILVESSLGFLGYGIPQPAPAWGSMLSLGVRWYMLIAPWIAIFPGVAISLVVFGFNMLGDALRDVLDPDSGALDRRRGEAACQRHCYKSRTCGPTSSPTKGW